MDELEGFVSPFGETFVKLRDKHLERLESEIERLKKLLEDNQYQKKDEIILQLQQENQSLKVEFGSFFLPYLEPFDFLVN